MKKIFPLLLVSVLGGAITLSAYKFFIEKKNNPQFPVLPSTTNTILTSNSGSNMVTKDLPSLNDAAEKAINAVVHVKNIAVSRGELTLEDLIYGRNPEREQLGTGSGVFINQNGYIVTNYHVIQNADKLSVTLNNNKTYDAEIIGTDPKTDIALLKINANEPLPYVTFADSDQVKIGDWVLAVGNPFNLTSTVTAGIISAKARDLSGKSTQSFLQTDAAVNPGNSGGALINVNGELVGINTAITSQTGAYIGYSFAIPSNIAKRVIEDIMEYGNVQNGVLGITGGDLNSAAAKELGINETEGIYVASIIEGSGADLAGIKQGDIIKEIDNIKVSKFADLTGHISAKRINDVVSLNISRGQELKKINVTLKKEETLTLPIIGLTKNASKKDLKSLNAENGIKILDFNKAYQEYWEQNGIQEGSIITAINNKKINSVEDAKTAIESYKTLGYIKIDIINLKGEKESYNFR